MDSHFFPVLTAMAGLVTGTVLCWLLMRGHVSAAAQAKPAVQTELALTQARVRTLEVKLLTLQDQEKVHQQAALSQSASDTENTHSLQRVSAPLGELEDENVALKRHAASLSPPLQAPSKHAITPDAQAAQLPVLEAEVLALQNLAKTIQQEFLLLADIQRNFTAASAALESQMTLGPL